MALSAERDFDVIVVGARVAGAATALQLARGGLRVLVVDRVSLPSDTLSSHQVQVPGVARLHRWGLLARLQEAATPPTRTVRFDPGHVAFEGRFPRHDGVDALYSPRRTVLDKLLVEAAQESGAEVRERFRVAELIWSQGRVIGIAGGERGGHVRVTARLVIGADGKHSTVADAVAAPIYHAQPPMAFASYSYWSGMDQEVGELYQRPRRAVAVFPTNDDLVMIYTAGPIADFAAYRSDPEAQFLATLDRCGTLGERARSGARAERLRATPDQPNAIRTPCGPGWALVGDAGVVMDSISAQGIGNALHHSELLARAVCGVLPGRGRLADRRLDDALRTYHHERDAAVGDMYDFTVDLARFTRPRYLQRLFLTSLKDRPAEISRFLGAFTGIIPIRDYFTAANAIRTIATRFAA